MPITNVGRKSDSVISDIYVMYVTDINNNITVMTVNIGKHNLQFYIHFNSTEELQWLEHGWLVYHGCFKLVL